METHANPRGRFVLGLGSLHHLNLPAQRQRFLQGALDLGVRHFDVAPMYGNGLDERELGIALRGRRSDVTIATKFGIPFMPYGDWTRLGFLPLRVADRLLPGYRARQAARDYSPEALQASVESSLRRLQTDHIDYLLLHEPPPHAEGIDAATLIEQAGKLRTAGKIGLFGVAGDHAASAPWTSLPGIGMIQGPLGTIAPATVDARRRAFSVYRHYAAACPDRARSFETYVADLWTSHPDIDLLFATRSPARLQQFAGLIAR